MKTKARAVVKDTFTFFRAGLFDVSLTIMVHQEFDGAGNHRLCCNGLYSAWTGYRSIAHLAVRNMGQWYGTSEYYAGELPRVFQAINSLEDCNIQ